MIASDLIIIIEKNTVNHIQTQLNVQNGENGYKWVELNPHQNVITAMVRNNNHKMKEKPHELRR